jgi:hypothetical protein
MSNAFKWPALILVFFNLAYFVWAVSSGSGDENQTGKKLALEGAKIKLLDEASEEELIALKSGIDGQSESIDSLDGFNLATEPYCPSLGPFESKVMLKQVGQRLAESGLGAKARSVVTDSSEKYRVYIPPYGDRQQAEAVLRKLRAKKIDSYIMSDAGFVNAISLGIFSSKDSAEGLRSKMVSNGYHAKLQITFLDKEVFWLDIPKPPSQEKADQILVNLMSEIEGVTRIDSPCKVVALAQ